MMTTKYNICNCRKLYMIILTTVPQKKNHMPYQKYSIVVAFNSPNFGVLHTQDPYGWEQNPTPYLKYYNIYVAFKKLQLLLCYTQKPS